MPICSLVALWRYKGIISPNIPICWEQNLCFLHDKRTHEPLTQPTIQDSVLNLECRFELGNQCFILQSQMLELQITAIYHSRLIESVPDKPCG